MSKIKKVVLAYSGGLDTSVIIPWLKENYGCEVIAYASNVGQGEELKDLIKKGKATGASKVIIDDVQREFVTDFIYPTLRANAVYEQRYLLGTSVARPIIAKGQIEVAHKEGADAVCHGATGKGNDQVRFELTYKALDPNMKIIAPWREWELTGREDCYNYCKERKIPVPGSIEKPYSMDRNLWHLSFEGGILEDPNTEPPKETFIMTKQPEKAPNKAETVEISFEEGIPTKVNGKSLKPENLVMFLNEFAGKHAVGRIDIVENRLVGMKSRGVYEAPGATLLYAAHRELMSLILDRETMHWREIAGIKYGELVYNGQWYTPMREALDAMIAESERYVTGKVSLKLYKGNVTVVGRTSKYSLYDPNIVTFEEGSGYKHSFAEGFIACFGLPLQVRAKSKQTPRGI